MKFQPFVASDSSSSSSSDSESDASSSSSSTSSSGSSSPSRKKTGRCDLLLSQLSMFPGEAEQTGSVAAKNGRDSKRIKKAMANPCQCRQNCSRGLSVRAVQRACCLFWGLTKAAQDCILWSIQAGGGSDKSRSKSGSSSSASGFDQSASKTASESSASGPSSSSSRRVLHNWYIEGQAGSDHCSQRALTEAFTDILPLPGTRVCRQAFIKILGISGWRLIRTRKNFRGLDARTYSALAGKQSGMVLTSCYSGSARPTRAERCHSSSECHQLPAEDLLEPG